MSSWQKFAETLQELHFGDNDIAEAACLDKKFCVGKHAQHLFAFSLTCPHAGVRLAGGYLDAQGRVVCPLHHYKFCIKTGKNITGEGYYLRHWSVEVRENGVYIYF